jgi:hypothetical protein
MEGLTLASFSVQAVLCQLLCYDDDGDDDDDDDHVRDERSHNMLEVHVEETNCHGRVDLALVLTLCQK